MTMGDTIYVTREMMAYLNGEREELKAETTVDGIWRDFFNEQDRLHMKDVKQIFDWSKRVRFMAGVTASFSKQFCGRSYGKCTGILRGWFYWQALWPDLWSAGTLITGLHGFMKKFLRTGCGCLMQKKTI